MSDTFSDKFRAAQDQAGLAPFGFFAGHEFIEAIIFWAFPPWKGGLFLRQQCALDSARGDRLLDNCPQTTLAGSLE